MHESWKVEGSMITNILIATPLGGSNVKINDFGIDVFAYLKCCYEWSDILESSTTYKL